MFKIKLYLFSLLGLSVSNLVYANAVDEFIQELHVFTYNCPDDQFIPQLDNYLQQNNISAQQRIKLQVYKAHWLICMGKNEQAYSELLTTLSDPAINKQSLMYARIHYLLAFILDVQDKPEHCDYYQQANKLSKNKFNDIYLSSQLGLITMCDKDKQDIGVKLGRLFALLKQYSALKDKQALAHIHNNIGLMFSSIGQMSLAAEQYEKSYQIGLEVYEQKNQVAPLISVITAYTGSGEFDKVEEYIEELRQQNLKVNTPLTNNWYHFAQSRYAHRTENYELLGKSLRSWQVFIDQISNHTMRKLFDWYSAVLCLHDQDRACVEAFINNQTEGMPARLAKHAYYIGFLVKAHLFLGNIELAQQSFERYATVTLEKIKNQQSSGRVLGVAQLHNQIWGLENSLQQAEQKRIVTFGLVVLFVLVLLLIVYFTLGRPYLRKRETDELTALLSEKAVLKHIKQVKKADETKVNALALFEISNLHTINAEYGIKTAQFAIKHAANGLAHVTRDNDLLGRIGEDQFVVCLNNIEENMANEMFARILNALNNSSIDLACGQQIVLKISMHVYNPAINLADADELISEIRHALSKE